MNIFAAAQRLMTMSDDVWARHSNPWSVYTRFTCLPLIVLAIWSRVWLGWWALVPLALALLWTWYNPRAFGPPARTDNWASMGTFGERVFLNRKALPVPHHHARMAMVLTWVSAVGMAILVYGLVVLNLWATICGILVGVGGKVWFVDRMVWLYRDMKDASPDYAAWLKPAGTGEGAADG